MASRFGVLDVHQTVSESPALPYLKRAVALRKVRRGLAEQIGERLIRILAVRRIPEPEPAFVVSSYIPESMPPRELPNCFFQRPPSDVNLIGFLAAQKLGNMLVSIGA